MSTKALTLAAALLSITSTFASAETTPPFSGTTVKFTFCDADPNDAEAKPFPECVSGQLPKLMADLESRLNDAMKSADPLARMLMKRDQAWFMENINAESTWYGDKTDEDMANAATRAIARIEERLADLKKMAAATKTSSLEGRWFNALATVDVTREATTLKALIEAKPVYGTFKGNERCRFEVDLKPGETDWIEGEVLVIDDEGNASPAELAYEGDLKPVLKARLQGETLRIAAFGHVACSELTGTFFRLDGPSSREAAIKPAVLPTFDCTKPSSATDEEICADPELADADQRMTRAWKAASAKLDKNTFAALKEDQRAYLQALANFYVYYLHAYWDKVAYYKFHVDNARDAVLKLMRERTAILEGLEPERKGLEGLWASSDALLTISADETGAQVAAGTKWESGDYKAYCEFNMALDVKGIASFLRADVSLPAEHAALKGEPNGLKIARDGGTLVISGAPVLDDGTICRRGLKAEGRLFPVKPSSDIGPENLMR